MIEKVRRDTVYDYVFLLVDIFAFCHNTFNDSSLAFVAFFNDLALYSTHAHT